jgi:hypothetical protein
MASVCYAGAIWAFLVVVELWDTAPLGGSLLMTAWISVGVVFVTRFALSSIVLGHDRLRTRGVFRNRSVDRHEIVGIETEPFKGSVLARLRLVSGASVGLPLGVQGGPAEMKKLIACLEAWRIPPDIDQHK